MSRLQLGKPFSKFRRFFVAGCLLQAASGAGTLADSSSKPAEPKFSLPSGLYTSAISVELSAHSPNEVVRYTLDGSEPSSASPEYSKPIHLSESTLLKAKVFGSGASSSSTVSEAYSFMESDLAVFSSNLPLVVLDTFGQRVPYGQKIAVAARFIEPKPDRSSLPGSADFQGLGEINIRGHTSLRYPKHSYHFQTKQEGAGSTKVALLGLPKESDWVLYGPYSDKSLIRDVLGYELSNQIGRYAARTRLVEVFLNDSGGKLSQHHYLGVYVFEEKIKRGKHRVDIDKLTPQDDTEPNISGGYIIKKDHSDAVDNPDPSIPMFGVSANRKESSFRSSHGGQFYYVEPKGDEITAEQKTWLKQYVNKFERVLYSDDFKDPTNGYAAYIDPDSFIDHHLLVELSKNIDGFRFSTFYYKDRGGRLNMGPIWDWNLSFGNANAREGFNPEGWYWSQLDDRQYSWFRRLFEDPDFAQRYVDRWGQLRTNQFTIVKIMARIDELAAQLDEAQARNFRRWRILGRSVWPNAFVGQSFAQEIGFLKQWIQQRIEWMDQEFLLPPLFSIRGGPVNHGAKLQLHAHEGTVYYTLDGSDPRAPGGAVSRSARLYKSSIVLADTTSICCRATDGSRWSYPSTGKFVVGKP
ncbi:MAG TPA: CotH kinase family protein [Verrucomicrobiae bacterium]|nr:CotH kinase family protein [Verrucomicrobiae bacterium]